MDVLDDIVQVMELKSQLLSRTEISSPWRFRFESSPDAQFHIINFGEGFVCIDGDYPPQPVRSGDIVILPHGDGHEICDALDSPLTKAVEMNHCHPDTFQLFPFAGAEPITVLLCGIFYFSNPQRHPFLDRLPPLMYVSGSHGRLIDGFEATLGMIATESQQQRPGSTTMLQHLTDMLFIQALRAWIAHDRPEQAVWFDALRDPQIGQALYLIHQQPEANWSVDKLAREVAVSRTAFSARFSRLVGQSPIRYLTNWRMLKASRLLRSQQSIGAVAQAVGYESEVAFRKAFKREMGIPPGQFRRQSSQ